MTPSRNHNLIIYQRGDGAPFTIFTHLRNLIWELIEVINMPGRIKPVAFNYSQ